MVAVARDLAGVAECSGAGGDGGAEGRRRGARGAGEAGVDGLAERTERARAFVERVGEGFARVGFELELRIDVARSVLVGLRLGEVAVRTRGL